MVKIGLVHATMNSVQPTLKAFKNLAPNIELVNVMDESLIFELNKTNIITEDMVRRLIEIAAKLELANVDAIMLTCSSFSPYVDGFKHLFSVPIISSDESMISTAIKKGSKIGVIATVEKAGPTTTKLLYKEAEKQNKNIIVTTSVIKDAFMSLEKGNKKLHDELIQSEIDKLQSTNDVVLLAQYSMTRALTDYSGDLSKVITAPEISVSNLINIIENEN